MVESPSTQMATLSENGAAAREARQKELDQLLEGMLCNVQDIPDLKSEFCPQVDIDSIPSELDKCLLPAGRSPGDLSRQTVGAGKKMSHQNGGFHTPGRHHSMRDEFLRSRVQLQHRKPPNVDPEWASLLM
jgi:hypothetical protein